MKIYISADIEGITGTTHWDETEKGKSDYNEFREQMTAEVSAACDGALQAGATEIWLKDAHASARNIIASKLPHEVQLIRGWSGHPFVMVQELDESFDAMLLIGYHSAASSSASPLAHTISGHAGFHQDQPKLRLRVPSACVRGCAGRCASCIPLRGRWNML